jgi:hypothetical protein
MNMYYVPPREWPPPLDWPPPCDDWRPPEFWTPRHDRPPLPPSGRGVLIKPDPAALASVVDDSAVVDESEAEEQTRTQAVRMLAVWARAVRREAHSYYQAALRVSWIDRAIDYAEDWSPSEEDLAQALEILWVRGYHLVMAAYQMESWRRLYAPDESDDPEVKLLHHLRNSVEHLSNAVFDEFSARSGGRNRAHSIEDLPGQELFRGFRPDFMEKVFGFLDLSSLAGRAASFAYIDSDTDEV